MVNWISVEDDLPKSDDEYLVFTDNKMKAISFFDVDTQNWYDDTGMVDRDDIGVSFLNITHWAHTEPPE